MQEHTNDLDLAAGLDYLDDRHERIEQAINEVLSDPDRGQQARELPEKWQCYTEQELRICLKEILSKFGI